MNRLQNDEQLNLQVSRVSGIYQKMTLEVFLEMIKRLKVRGAADLADNPYIWQIEKLNDMHMLNRKTLQIMSRYSGISEKLLLQVIKNEGLKIYDDTRQQLLEDLQRPDFGDHYGVEHELSAYATQTFREVDNFINTSLSTEIQRGYKSIVEHTVARVVAGTMTTSKALNRTIYEWFDNDFYGFIDKSGRRWRPDVYARTVITSTVWRTYNEMSMRPGRELGIDTFYYSINPTAREMCAPLQGQIVTEGMAREEQGVKILSLQDYGYGEAGGCRGINCRHTMTPFIVGVNEIPKPTFDVTPEEAVMNGKIKGQQRAMERNIRRLKELHFVAEKAGDKEKAQSLKVKIKEKKQGLKTFIDMHDFLHFDPQRIKLYGPGHDVKLPKNSSR